MYIGPHPNEKSSQDPLQWKVYEYIDYIVIVE